MTEALYLSPNTPTFKVKVGREKLQALKGVLRCPAHLVAELDALIAKRQDVKANLKKIDMKKAEETVREHQAKERKQGVAGPFASDNGNKATLRAERDKLRASGNATTDPETGKETTAIKEMMPPQPPLTVAEMPQASNQPKGIANILAGQAGGRFGGKK